MESVNAEETVEELEKETGKTREELFSVVEYKPEEAERIAYSNYSYWGSVWSNFIKKKSVLFFGIIFLILLACVFICPYIGHYRVDNLHTNLFAMYTRPNSEYWFGTDAMGRDYWVQVWSATKNTIYLSGGVAIGTTLLSVIMGCLWGYVRALDKFFIELHNIISNIPNIIYMTLVAMLVGKSLMILMVAMIITGWLGPARGIRNLVLLYRDREYNLASRCLGTGVGTVIMKNIIPYLVSVIFLQFSLSIPGTIGAETTLAYLGLGVGTQNASLGVLLANARTSCMDYPHLLIFPAVIVSIITVAFYIVGNAFSDACDPKNHV